MATHKREDRFEENPQWTREKLARSVRFEQLPAELKKTLSSRKAIKKEPAKVSVSIRLSEDVLAELRATGTGWQSRADEALRAWLKRQTKATR